LAINIVEGNYDSR